MVDWVRRRLTAKRCSCSFIDKVSGEEVFNYTDYDGKKFLATYNHWFFRVYSDESSKGEV